MIANCFGFTRRQAAVFPGAAAVAAASANPASAAIPNPKPNIVFILADDLGWRDAAKPFFLFLGYHEPPTPILSYPNPIGHFERKEAGRPPAPAPIVEHDGVARPPPDDGP
jgi:hypothetical protein